MNFNRIMAPMAPPPRPKMMRMMESNMMMTQAQAPMMAMNMNLSMNPMPFQNMNDSGQNITLQYLTLKFVVIPQNWDGSNDSSFPQI